MPPRPDVSESRKKQILDAAIIVFSKMGFHQARIDDIASESGLSKGAIYWYFKSKDEIVTSILESLFKREMDSLLQLQTDPSPASERLLIFTHHVLRDLKHMLDQMTLVYEFYAIALREERLRIVLRNYLRNFIELLVPIIQQGIDSGEFKTTNAEDATITVGAVLEGTILLWVYDPLLVDLDRHMESSLKLLLDGLKA